ncbi:MAG: PVC-type heme-binding CxxCH protein [Planctomycetaceae bacterium]
MTFAAFAPNAASAAEQAAIHSPVSADESLQHFQLHPGLRIELAATEPEVVDPVAIAFDERLRMWVVEMGDYPNGPQPGEEPKSRVRLLEDRDNDGYYETSHVFADKLLFATGIQPWRGGAIVTLAGRVAYFRDTDGDNRADIEETWFAGFAEENPQLRANHPTFALDNRIYIANGLRGGNVIARKEEWKRDAKPVSISGMDFCFDPLTGKCEAVSGNGQFGLTFDDFGNRFVCSNRNPCIHVVLEDRYIKRNPFLAVGSVVQDVSPAGEESRIFPVSRAWTTSTLHAGQFTAACGVTIYRGDLLPPEFRGNSFTCEPTGNLVHRDVLSAVGSSFSSKPVREGVEFLATKDEWFRPVNLANGPDGALYVVDMYRAVIEHPQWVPEELKNRPDNYYGNDRGRIYRIVPASSATRRQVAFDDNDPKELVQLLAHSNAWHRETAARLIYERQDKSLAGPLAELAANSQNPEARIHSLWALSGLGVLADESISRAMADSHPRVCEHALRLAESRLRASELLQDALRRVAPDDARLRFQFALTLGEMDVGRYFNSLIAAARDGADDAWTRLAICSSVGEYPVELLTQVLHRTQSSTAGTSPGRLELAVMLAEIIGSRQKPEEIQQATVAFRTFRSTSEMPPIAELQRVGFAGLNGLGRGSRRRGKPLATFLAEMPDPVKEGTNRLFGQAAEVARAPQADVPLRQSALDLLRNADYARAGETLIFLATREADQPVRLAAIAALGSYAEPEIGDVLLSGFETQSPIVRRAILDVLLSDVSRTRRLLSEIDAGRIRPSELDASRTAQLTSHRDGEIQKQAKQLLAAAVPADRKQVLEEYRKALALKADPKRGREVFVKNCVACHRVGELGVNVAPDIADSRTRTPESLLTDILDPNRAIDNNYFSYTVVTVDGKVHTGVVAAETASSVTLKQQEGQSVSILRQDIDQMKSNGVSLMPVGLEKNITLEQMADLISFIKNWRYLDGRVPIDVGR